MFLILIISVIFLSFGIIFFILSFSSFNNVLWIDNIGVSIIGFLLFVLCIDIIIKYGDDDEY